MRDALEKKLFGDFPLLYARDADRRGSAMAFGFECLDGWYSLILTLSLKLYPLVLKEHETPNEYGCYPRATQVKEKFGGLRFYMENATDEMYALIDAAEEKSESTCEECGSPGSIDSSRNWLQCRCEEHRAR